MPSSHSTLNSWALSSYSHSCLLMIPKSMSLALTSPLGFRFLYPVLSGYFYLPISLGTSDSICLMLNLTPCGLPLNLLLSPSILSSRSQEVFPPGRVVLDSSPSSYPCFVSEFPLSSFPPLLPPDSLGVRIRWQGAEWRVEVDALRSCCCLL